MVSISNVSLKGNSVISKIINDFFVVGLGNSADENFFKFTFSGDELLRQTLSVTDSVIVNLNNKDIYVIEQNNTPPHDIVKFNQAGIEVWRNDTRFTSSKPLALAIDDNYVYIGDNTTEITKLDKTTGLFVEALTISNGGETFGIAVSSNFIYAGTDAGVSKLEKDGTLVWNRRGARFRAVTFDNDGNVYGGSTAVIKWDADGNELWINENHTDTIGGIAVDDTTQEVYSSSDDTTIRKYDINGNELWIFSGHSSIVSDIDLGSDGFIYTASGDNSSKKIDSSGNEVYTINYPPGSQSYSAVSVAAT